MWRIWLFMLPSCSLLGAVLLWPLGYAIYLSLLDYKAGGVAQFIGLQNFVDIAQSTRFWSALWNTCVIAFWALSAELVAGLLLALGLNALRFGARAFIVALFLPYIITPVVSGLILKWMFVSNWGLIDATLAGFGLQAPDWLGDPFWARATVVMADAWVSTPLVVLILFAALQQIDSAQIEAAKIDGASPMQVVRHVVLPAISPMIVFVAAVRLMDIFRSFDIIYVLTGGGPGTATETLTLLTYQTGFRLFDIGKASALGLTTLGLVFMLVVMVAKVTPRLLGRSPS